MDNERKNLRPRPADEVGSCPPHLLVKDTRWMITGEARTVPGDCFCVRCCQPVPYKLTIDPIDGKAFGEPVT